MAGIVNLLSQMFIPQSTQVTAPVRNYNPYSNNPFVSYNGNSLNNYAKNSPVRGGYLQDTIMENKILSGSVYLSKFKQQLAE